MVRVLAFLLLLTAAACAQNTPPAPNNSPRQERTYTLPPDKLAKAIAYSDASNRLHFISVGYGFLVLLAVLTLRLGPRFRNWAQNLTARRFVQAYVFGTLLVLTVDILGLPTDIAGHHLSVKYEQSVQGWGSWFWDWTKGELIGVAVTGFLLWVLYGIIRRSPKRWWFYFWLVSIPMVIFVLFITPVLVEPLFFKFSPLEATQPALVAQIEKVVQRGGLEIAPSRMFEMDASQKLNSLNAYVSGVGASKRVVVWDTTIRKMTPDEILFVFGHEMGHYVLGHNWILIGVTSGVILLFLFLGYHAMRWALGRWGEAWEIRGIPDWASAPVLMLAFAVFSFASEPVLNSISRTLEHDADIYGLEVIHGLVPDSPQVAAQAFQILGEVSLSNPNPSPFIEFWLYDHPSVGDRVRFASQYDPWATGAPRKYVQ